MESAAMYADDLEAKVEHGYFSPAIDDGIRRLVSLLRQVIPGTITFDAKKLGFAASDLKDAGPDDVLPLINDWTLGWGRDDAPVISLGTEEAYSADEPDALAIWNCSCAVIWAVGGDPRVVEAIDPRYVQTTPARPSTARQFHIHANDYLLVHLPRLVNGRWRRAGRHTWRLLAEVLAGRGNELDLLAPTTGRLGDICYQVEASAYPSTSAAAGREPSARRQQFLLTLVEHARESARVLLFHGRPHEPTWANRLNIGETFLNLDPGRLNWIRETFGSQPLAWCAANDRLVILTRALNGSVRGDLIDRIHKLVAPYLAER
jgi:hypothetical protein